jgi:2-polyprenyl-3-methyl-5-hydroxy-6-metoxy-1,4-benzoquinol methylase
MDYQLVNKIKKYPCIYRNVRNLHLRLRCTPLYYIKTLILDPHHLKQSNKWYTAIKNTQIEKGIPLFLDRQREIQRYFKKNNLDLLRYFLSNGCPNSKKFENKLSSFFQNRTKRDSQLKEAYKKAAYHYSLRLMIAYERYSYIIPYMNQLKKQLNKPIKKWRVTDYGCGVSDCGLLFSSLGARVTIVDLDDEKLDFTRLRFSSRGLQVKVLKIESPDQYPALPKKQDLIIATEVLEHVRDPFQLLKNFHKALHIHGLLFDSMGGIFSRDFKSKGDHLKEAYQIGNSNMYTNFYQQHFYQLKLKREKSFLFKKMK